MLEDCARGLVKVDERPSSTEPELESPGVAKILYPTNRQIGILLTEGLLVPRVGVDLAVVERSVVAGSVFLVISDFDFEPMAWTDLRVVDEEPLGPLALCGEEGLDAGGVEVGDHFAIIGVEGETQTVARTVFGAEAGQRQYREPTAFRGVDVGIGPTDSAGPEKDRRQSEEKDRAFADVCVACY